MQRALLEQRALRVEAMIAAIDKALEAERRGTTMDEHELFEVFGDFDPAEYEQEVTKRWGDTGAYATAARRTARYTKVDWQRIKAEDRAIIAALIARLDEGSPPDDPAVMHVVEQHRLHIDRYFYPCSKVTHRQLGEMYVADPRFKRTYDDQREGLAEYLRNAIVANAAG